MKVIITASVDGVASAVTGTIAAGGREGPRDYTSNSTIKEQIAEGVDAESATFFNRLNEQTTITFSVHRVHDSEDLAESFINLHAAQLIRAGKIEFIPETESESSTNLTGIIVTVSSTQNGASTLTQYTIKGGKISTI